jgi:hypothetical protein
MTTRSAQRRRTEIQRSRSRRRIKVWSRGALPKQPDEKLGEKRNVWLRRRRRKRLPRMRPTCRDSRQRRQSAENKLQQRNVPRERLEDDRKLTQ